MRGDIPPAALRLCAELHVRTITRAPARREPPQAAGNRYRRRAVRINGVTYDTLRAARAALHIGYERFYEMLDKGEAEYV